MQPEINLTEDQEIEQEPMFTPIYKEDSFEKLTISNSFIENMVINTERSIIKFEYLNSPVFVDKNGDSISKLIVAVLDDSSIAIFSSVNGKLLLSNSLAKLDPGLGDIDLASNLQSLITDSYQQHMIVSLSDLDGNIYALDIGLKQLPRNDNESISVRNTARPSSDLILKSMSHFNLWDIIINSNKTLYEQEFNNMKQSGLSIIHMGYYGNSQSGVYIFADNFGYFTLIRKDSKFNKEVETPNEHKFKMLKRVFSRITDIKIIKNQVFLNIFANDHKIGFLRSYDGQVADSY